MDVVQNLPTKERLGAEPSRQTAYIGYQSEQERKRKKYLGCYRSRKEKYHDKPGPYSLLRRSRFERHAFDWVSRARKHRDRRDR